MLSLSIAIDVKFEERYHCASRKLYITFDIWLPTYCNLSQFVLPGNHAVSCTDPPSGLLAGAVVFQRLQDKISHEAVGNYTRS